MASSKNLFFRSVLLAVSFCNLINTPLGVRPILAAVDLTTEQKNKIAEIQGYLNGLSTFKATLVQQNPDQTEVAGTVYMSRTGSGAYGKLRLEYQAPSKDLIIVDGRELIHHDLASKEVNRYGIDSTPAGFLLKKRINFSDDLHVKEAQFTDDAVRLTLVNRGDSEGMSLTLVFVTKPILILKEWTVFDGQGNTTAVKLSDVTIGMPLDQKLFQG